MARKLKSDKLLFMATLLLVCTSVVMVYSASAVLAMARYQQPYWFLIEQATWAVLGIFMLAVTMRIDYRTYREPVVIWTALAVVTLALVAVLFRAPINGTRRWFGIGGIGRAAVRAGEVGGDPLHRRRCSSAGWTGSTKSATRSCPSRSRSALVTGLILLQPDYGTACRCSSWSPPWCSRRA